jgi:hypothetical protein
VTGHTCESIATARSRDRHSGLGSVEGELTLPPLGGDQADNQSEREGPIAALASLSRALAAAG